MTELVINAQLFTLPLRRGVPIPLKKQLEVSAQGLDIVLNTLQGLNQCVTIVYSEEFFEYRPDLFARAKNDGHKIVSIKVYKTQFSSKVFGINLGGAAIQRMPNDLYCFLVRLGNRKGLTLQYDVWNFSEAVYDSVYRLRDRQIKNCGILLVRRFSLVANMLKELPR